MPKETGDDLYRVASELASTLNGIDMRNSQAKALIRRAVQAHLRNNPHLLYANWQEVSSTIQSLLLYDHQSIVTRVLNGARPSYK